MHIYELNPLWGTILLIIGTYLIETRNKESIQENIHQQEWISKAYSSTSKIIFGIILIIIGMSLFFIKY